MPTRKANAVELTILMPCLNEAETIGTCIRKAQKFLKDHEIRGEILVADNGSTDGSKERALELGARVIDVETKGYGSALLSGIRNARGKYIVMGDADDSYDFGNLLPFVDSLRKGYDLVMGNRFKGGIAPSAMPFLHRYLGNPVLTLIGRILFKSSCADFHCGLRGFNRVSIIKLNLRTTGMEFATEMVAKSSLHGLRITEVPTTLSPDGRSKPPHLRTWRDGWRHLRFMLLYSPNWLFLYPGIMVTLLAFLVGAWLVIGPAEVGTVTFDIHTLLVAAAGVVIGYQTIAFALFSKVFAMTEGLLPESKRFIKAFKYINLETGLLLGFLFVLLGSGGIVYAVILWKERSFGPLDTVHTMRLVIPSVTFLTIGFQTILASFFLSILGLKRR